MGSKVAKTMRAPQMGEPTQEAKEPPLRSSFRFWPSFAFILCKMRKCSRSSKSSTSVEIAAVQPSEGDIDARAILALPDTMSIWEKIEIVTRGDAAKFEVEPTPSVISSGSESERDEHEASPTLRNVAAHSPPMLAMDGAEDVPNLSGRLGNFESELSPDVQSQVRSPSKQTTEDTFAPQSQQSEVQSSATQPTCDRSAPQSQPSQARGLTKQTTCDGSVPQSEPSRARSFATPTIGDGSSLQPPHSQARSPTKNKARDGSVRRSQPSQVRSSARQMARDGSAPQSQPVQVRNSAKQGIGDGFALQTQPFQARTSAKQASDGSPLSQPSEVRGLAKQTTGDGPSRKSQPSQMRRSAKPTTCDGSTPQSQPSQPRSVSKQKNALQSQPSHVRSPAKQATGDGSSPQAQPSAKLTTGDGSLQNSQPSEARRSESPTPQVRSRNTTKKRLKPAAAVAANTKRKTGKLAPTEHRLSGAQEDKDAQSRIANTSSRMLKA